jgi:DNA repair exonuclease SbcCD ATPase subunit
MTAPVTTIPDNHQRADGREGNMEQQPAQKDAATPSAAKQKTPAEHLAELRAKLDAEQKRLLELEPVKTNIEDLTERIKALETLLAGQAEADAAYLGFYQDIERYHSEIACAIPVVRDQLDLSDQQRGCVDKAIEAVDKRVAQAQADSREQQAAVEKLREEQAALAQALARSTWEYEYFRSKLVEEVGHRRDDVQALNALADPSADQCETWFYLHEMEALLTSAHDGAADAGGACLDAHPTIGTFLDCWPPDDYAKAYQAAIVAFNAADNAHKVGAAVLEQAIKRAETLAKAAGEALAGRRDAILKEIRIGACCAAAAA